MNSYTMETRNPAAGLPVIVDSLKNVSCPKAVLAVNVNKSYRNGIHSSPILRNFNMTVKKGSIYSLLGSSGCGKTTILSSIVGLINVDSGKIFVHGSPPGTEASGVPGKTIGYMPQDIALVKEFSIDETLRYFGTLYSMNDAILKRNRDFLINLLQLPPRERRISTLSMWSHLLSLTASGETTIIITTHYIEEARLSNTVGLMRNGHLIAESSPEKLLELYDTNLLEDVVIRLCLKDNCDTQKTIEDTIISNKTFRNRKNVYEDGHDINVVGLKYQKKNPDLCYQNSTRQWNEYQQINNENYGGLIKQRKWIKYNECFYRLKALCAKNVLALTRNILYFIFMVIVPANSLILVGATVGGNVKGLKFGVINKDSNITMSYNDHDSHGCILHENYTGSASGHYLSLISNSSFLSLVNYETEEEALQDVLRTELYGYVYFPENFTSFMKERILFGFNVELETIQASTFTIHLDLSNTFIGGEMKLKLATWYSVLLENWASLCDIDKETMQTPITFTVPVYGTDDTDFTEYIAPSVLLGLLLFFSSWGSALSYIVDKKSGINARSQVTGVTQTEIMISYFIIYFMILLLQIGLAFMSIILIFNIKVQGSLMLAILITLMMGVAGMALGFLYTTFSTDEIQLTFVSIGIYVPNIILSGTIWPATSMPEYLQHFSIFLPCTFAGETLRSIISKGLGFSDYAVWSGFLATFLWISLYLAIGIIIIRRKATK